MCRPPGRLLLRVADRSLPGTSTSGSRTTVALPLERVRSHMLPSPQTLQYLHKARNGYVKLFPKSSWFGFSYHLAQVRGQQGSDTVMRELLADKPSMICRFGSTELGALVGYLGEKGGNKPSLINHLRFITGAIPSYGFEPDHLWTMANLSGFFPQEEKLLAKFCELMLEDMKYVDILGSWRREERFFEKELAHAIKVELPDLEPFLHKDPWSRVLEGKKVLVVHPFEKTVRSQYAKRELLFADKRVLPAFDLKTIRAVQTVAGNPTSFGSWFDALAYMKDKMSDTDYDVAIIGCGAYGFPLAAHAKRMGKKAVHIGGASQLLFGIRGARWEDHPLINEHWVRPDESERPEKASVVEGACYW